MNRNTDEREKLHGPARSSDRPSAPRSIDRSIGRSVRPSYQSTRPPAPPLVLQGALCRRYPLLVRHSQIRTAIAPAPASALHRHPRCSIAEVNAHSIAFFLGFSWIFPPTHAPALWMGTDGALVAAMHPGIREEGE